MRMIVMNLLSFLHLSDLFHLTSCSFTASVPRQSQEVHEELKAGSGIITDKTLFEHVVKQPYMLPTSGFFNVLLEGQQKCMFWHVKWSVWHWNLPLNSYKYVIRLSMIFLCILLISGQNIATSQQVHGKWWLGLVTSSQNLLLFPVWVLLFVCPK